MKEKTCYLVGAGEVAPLPSLSPDDLLIAVDGGLHACIAQGLAAQILVGDLDSFGDAPLPNIPICRFPVKKDETDTYLAYLEGVKRGYTNFEIYGGLGGRADHTVANLQLLRRIAGEGNVVALISDDARFIAFSDREMSIPTREGQSLGVFSLSETSTGVTIAKTAYTLTGGTLKNDFPLGVSNTALGDEVLVSVEKGILLCVLSSGK